VAANPSPCVSPYADSAGDVTAAIPEGGDKADIHLVVGQHLTVGWKACGESGALKTSDPAGAMLTSTDASSEGKGGPAIDVRYLALKEGTVTVTGEGSKGSNGQLVITITR
jgi:hypothetical protein